MKTTFGLSSYFKVEHYTLLRMIKKYESELKQLGDVILEKQSTSGNYKHFYSLNWLQVLFLTTLMKNSKVTVPMKLSLIMEKVNGG